MTKRNTSIGFQFRLTNVISGPVDYRTKQNVRKRIENIIYSEVPPADSVKLSYVGSKEITPTNNLFLGDRSDTLYENSRVGIIEEFVGTIQPITLNNNNFIITQQFNFAESGNIPLYYKYEVKVDPLLIVADSFAVFDKDFNRVSSDKFKVVLKKEYNEKTGIETEVPTYYSVYNNIESSFDPDSGDYKVFFLQYTKIDSVTGNDVVVTELLNNKLAYREATFEDLWVTEWNSGEIKPWIDAYLWLSGPDDTKRTLVLPNGNNYSIRYVEKSRMKVVQPIGLDDNSPWFLRVINGSFNSGYDGESISYSIPEFKNQLFNPIEPYKLAVNVLCSKIDNRFIKLPHEDIQQGSMFSSISITLQNNGIVEYAITSDIYKSGTEYKDIDGNVVYDSNGKTILWSSDLYLGVDSSSGIVYVGVDISDKYEIRSIYQYREDYFEITSMNMNPIFEDAVRKELRIVYVIPKSSSNNNKNQTQSIRWIKVNPSGKIGNTNQDGSGNNEDIAEEVSLLDANAYKIYGIIGLHYSWRATTSVLSDQEVVSFGQIEVSSSSSFPRSGWIRFVDRTNKYRYAEYTKKGNTSFTLSSNVPVSDIGIFIPSGNTIELVNFIDERTTLSNRSSSVENEYSAVSPSSRSRYFILAETAVNPPHSINEAIIIDVRKDGGGIIPEKYDEAKSLQPEIQWLKNYSGFRGQLYPGNATIVVKLSSDIFEKFSESDIEKIINEDVPLGTLPLIRRFGYEPEIISVIPSGLGFGEDVFGNHHFGE